jgi:hypothetical protein
MNDTFEEACRKADAEIAAKKENGKTTLLELKTILDDVHTFLGRFVIYPSKEAHDAHVLWIAHAHVMDAWESTPRMAFLSPEPASGKTRALEVSELLVPNPVEAVNVSPAYLFRKVGGQEGGLPTILYDEIDTVFGPKAKENEEIRALLNSGHRRGAVAGRMGAQRLTPARYPIACAVLRLASAIIAADRGQPATMTGRGGRTASTCTRPAKAHGGTPRFPRSATLVFQSQPIPRHGGRNESPPPTANQPG